MIRIASTDGENKDFVLLCAMLDDNLDDLVGGRTQRQEYLQYNKLDDIHDVILIYDDSLPIACAAFKYFSQGTAEVKRVFLRKGYRGKGLAEQLMTELEAQAKKQGYTSLVLETGKPLVAAIGLYHKMGYKIIENYGQYKNMPLSVCMQKDLS